MSAVPRRRLTAAERRVVDPVVTAAAGDVQPMIDAAGQAIADRYACLPVEVRYEALVMLMNTIGGRLFETAQAGLIRLEIPEPS